MKKILFIILTLLLTASCVTPYQLESTVYEDVLVVEATLTNELKQQKIKLSRTNRLDAKQEIIVKNAIVKVTDNANNTYNFNYADNIYTSTSVFAAIPNRTYTLTIFANGKTYTSSPEVLSPINPITDITIKDETFLNVRGAAINAKAFDPTNTAKYYRYEYEETYKIIAPKYSVFTATVTTLPAPVYGELVRTPRTVDVKTCYSTNISNEIILANTSLKSEARVDEQVRFISIENPIIMHRYSILVKQYVQSLASHTYYETLKKLAGNGSILSQSQPGFVYGNITCTSDNNEKVIGLFEVSSYSEKRVFFNFDDLFGYATRKPKYFFECFDGPCDPICPGQYKFCFYYGIGSDCQGDTVKYLLNDGALLYYYGTGTNIFLVPPPCGDCTKFSSNVLPPFWQ